MYVLIGVIIGTILWRIGCMYNTRMVGPDAKYRHKWRLSRYTTPSGKLLYYCPEFVKGGGTNNPEDKWKILFDL